MKKDYITPDFEIITFHLENVCNGVIHASFENGGDNSGWEFNDDFDDPISNGEPNP